MPRAARYSTATKDMVSELADRGHKVGCRAVEHWAELGLASPPVRFSIGKGGSRSQYPVGAIHQYDAVASVMRKGRDWRVAGLLLIGRGYLPANEAVLRFLLEFLIPDQIEADDPLAVAEEAFKQIAGSPFHRIFDRIIRNNLALAKLIDPVTREEICIESAVSGVVTQVLAALLGDPLPDGAAEEIAAGWGLINPDLSIDERLEGARFVEGFFAAVTFRELSKAAKTVAPARLQRIIAELRYILEKHPVGGFELVPGELLDILFVIVGLAITMIDDLGGDAWFRMFAT